MHFEIDTDYSLQPHNYRGFPRLGFGLTYDENVEAHMLVALIANSEAYREPVAGPGGQASAKTRTLS